MHYSRDRAEVETEIAQLMLSGSNKDGRALPQTPTMAAQWPVDASALPAAAAPAAEGDAEGAPKKKRKRKRKPKAAASEAGESTPVTTEIKAAKASPAPQPSEGTLPEDGSASINLR